MKKRVQIVLLPTNQKAKIGEYAIFSYDETVLSLGLKVGEKVILHSVW